MKFLVDVCAGNSIGQLLKSEGNDVSFVRDNNPRMGDEDILAWAFKERRVLITIDKDFGFYIFHEEQPHHGIIRLPNVPKMKRLRLIEEVINSHSDDLENGAIITVSLNRIRVRRMR